MTTPYGYEIPKAPSRLDGSRVLSRVVDGLAFRYYWATHDLRPEDHAFRPAPSAMSCHELLEHILRLVFIVQQVVRNASERERFDAHEPEELRRKTLTVLEHVRKELLSLDDETLAGHEIVGREGRRYPVWNIMNGPLSDALTHVGQINAWRRLSGNPTPPANVFEGVPPE